MMRCRTGSAQSSGAPSLKACGGPDQRRTASRLLRPKIVEGLVYALALRRIRDTEPRCVSSSVVGASLETRRLAKPGRLRPMIDAQVVLNGLVLGGLYACVAVGFSLVWGVLNIINLLHDVSFQLWPGEIVGLIGPNGAGKTTLVNLTTGALRPTAGRARFDGRDVTGQQPHQAARRAARAHGKQRRIARIRVMHKRKGKQPCLPC
jgi:hypothetical protein